MLASVARSCSIVHLWDGRQTFSPRAVRVPGGLGYRGPDVLDTAVDSHELCELANSPRAPKQHTPLLC